MVLTKHQYYFFWVIDEVSFKYDWELYEISMSSFTGCLFIDDFEFFLKYITNTKKLI